MPNLDELLNQVDAARDDIVALEQDLIRIPSVNTGSMPTGNETAVCEFVRGWLAEDGVKCRILESAPGRGNLIARLEGTSSKPGLMFMSHTDEVPVEDETKWRFPPFSGTLADGRIYGRGASDCKGVLTAHLMALRLLKRNGVPLRDGLILASGADEESGGRYGFGWLAKHHAREITAPYAVNECGGTPVDAAGGLAYLINLGEKGRLQVEIDIKGVSAHASMPWLGTNASYRLGEALRRIEGYEAERDTSAKLFDHLSTFAIEHKPSSENVDQIVAEVEERDPRFALILRALSRMTLTPTMIQAGVKSNSVPESVRLTCDVRTLPHQDESYLADELSGLLEGIPGLDFEIDYTAVPNSSPFESEFVERIKAATARVVGRDDIQWVPGLCQAYTDSRFTRPLGVETYGFVGMHPDDDPLQDHWHGTDESVSVRTLVTSTKIMLALAYDLLAER